jgi:hypothetical protein
MRHDDKGGLRAPKGADPIMCVGAPEKRFAANSLAAHLRGAAVYGIFVLCLFFYIVKAIIYLDSKHSSMMSLGHD